MHSGPYLTVAEVAELIRKNPKTVRNLMVKGVFRERVHYFRPRGSSPLFKREAIIQWIEGTEPLPEPKDRRRQGVCRVNLALIPALKAGKTDY